MGHYNNPKIFMFMRSLSQHTMCLILTALVFSSCGYKKEAIEVTQNFFSAIKNEKEEKMAEFYPEVGKLPNYYKSDSIVFKEAMDLGDNKYSVSVTNMFTNGYGKRTESQIVIFTKPKDENNPGDGYEVYDSQGLCDFSDDAVYKFAKRKRYLTGDSLTDQRIVKIVVEARKDFIELAVKFTTYLYENVKVSDWNWETSDYNYSASGRGVVKNNTKYAIPDVKYIVTYMKRDGTEVTQDKGSVTYDEIRPYGMESFSFYTSYVGNASRATIKLEFDDEFVLETVAKGEYE